MNRHMNINNIDRIDDYLKQVTDEEIKNDLILLREYWVNRFVRGELDTLELRKDQYVQTTNSHKLSSRSC